MSVLTMNRDLPQFGDCEAHGRFERRDCGRLGWRGGCPQCSAEREAVAQEAEHRSAVFALSMQADIPARFLGKTFAVYQPNTARQKAALAACMQYVDRIEESAARGPGLVLVGPPGTGKTHLLTAIVQQAVQRRISARYTTAPDVLAAVKGDWSWHGEERGRQYVTPQVLALDEVWPKNDAERNAVFALIDARYRSSRPTLLATNLTWPELKATLGDRSCDRLLDGGQIIPLDGESHRKPR
jgi:DNA replication protein DnaC